MIILDSLPAALLSMVAIITVLVYALPRAKLKPIPKTPPKLAKPAALFINDEMYGMLTKIPDVSLELSQYDHKVAGLCMTYPYVGIPVYRSHILNNIS